jgi:hypothetical protein
MSWQYDLMSYSRENRLKLSKNSLKTTKEKQDNNAVQTLLI